MAATQTPTRRRRVTRGPASAPGTVSASADATIPLRPAPIGTVRAAAEVEDTPPDASQQDVANPAQNPSPSSPEEFVLQALRRWRTVNGAETQLRKDQRQDLDFFHGDQWPAEIKDQRSTDGRPCLTINRIAGFARQIINESREAKPGIEVDPGNAPTDIDTAEDIEGLIQHIEYNSDAEVAYDTAVQGQVRVGRGWFRIVPEYASDDTFEQELRIKRIRNPFTVYMDPAAQQLDGSDARFCIIVDDLPNDEYRPALR